MNQPLSHSDLERLLRDVAVNRLKLDESRLVPTASLRDDLDLDSIDMFDILAFFESNTGRKLHGDSFKSVQTLQQFIERLGQELGV